MTREGNGTLWSEWRDRVTRYERRAESSAEFCRRENVPEASLLSWRRRLATEIAPAESAGSPTCQATTPTFLPVRLSTRQLRGAEVRGRIEIELSNGAVVQFTGDAERLLRDAIAAARGAVRLMAADDS